MIFRKERVNINTINITEMENVNMDVLEVNTNFYEKYNHQIRVIVARILSNANQSGDIEDCVNEVYLEIMTNLQKYNESKGSLSAFIAIIARSTALDYCKSNRRKHSELIGDAKIDYITDPLEVEDQIDFTMLIDMIFEKLNEQESILFTMKYLYHYPAEEIAKSFKINRNAVDGRVNRLKQKIQKLLIKGGITV